MTLRGVALTVMLFAAGFWIGPAVAACVGSPYQRIEQLDLDISRRPATALREIDSALGDLPARPFDYRYYTWLRLLRIIAAPDGHQDPIAATARPAMFSGHGVVPTRQAVGYHPQGTPSSKSGGVPALDPKARRPRQGIQRHHSAQSREWPWGKADHRSLEFRLIIGHMTDLQPAWHYASAGDAY